jgi:PadR family transcriptional regulator, regulatory protein PadR
MPLGPTRALPISEPQRLSAALGGLGEREREILELRYGLGGERPHSLAEIGRRLGISGERVRQLETRALRRLGAEDGMTPAKRMPPSEALSTPFPRNSLRAWTLLLLRLRPGHGYDLMERLRELGLSRPGPQLYRLLRELEENGFLTSDWAGGGVGPDRRVYRLTEKGALQLEEDAAALERVSGTLQLFFRHYAELADQFGSGRRLRSGRARR